MRALVSAAAVLAVVLTGCGSTPEEEPAASEKAAAAAGVGWSPCDGLTAREVSALAGEPVRASTGTEEAPRCVFLPKKEGGPAYDVSYLFFDGGLDAALDAMGSIATQLEPIDVPGADAARLAVRERKDGILVTGFVQTGGLVQSVNAVDLAPFDRDRIVTSTTQLLEQLAERAPRG